MYDDKIMRVTDYSGAGKNGPEKTVQVKTVRVKTVR